MMKDAVMRRTNALMEDSKMLQNAFLQFLIRNRLRRFFETWHRSNATPALDTIPGMPLWIHNLQQYCVDQTENENNSRKDKFQEFANKIKSDSGAGRANISEKDIDSTLAVQLLWAEGLRNMNSSKRTTYKRYLNESRTNRNSLSHYTPNTPLDTKMADIKNLTDNLEEFINFVITDLNSRNESTDEPAELQRILQEQKTEFDDIVGEKREHIQYLSRITAYVKRVENSFLEMLSKFVHLDINEDIIKHYSSSYIDEILVDEKTVPRSGKIEEILPTIDERKMLLTGGPGVGKSTTLAFLAYRDADRFLSDSDTVRDRMEIPVLLHLNTLTKEDVSVIDKIAENLKISVEQVRFLLDAGKIRLYFDGLNEIPNAAGTKLKQKRISEIRDLVRNYPEVLIVCSTRESDVEFLQGFPCFRVLPMNETLVKEFIEKNAGQEFVRKLLLEEFEHTRSLLKNVRTPLYVTRLIAVVSETGRMPRNEAHIIGAYLNGLLKREHFDKAADIDPQKVCDLLSEFAYDVREKYKTNVPVRYETIIDCFDKKQMYPKTKLREILDLCIDIEIISAEDEDMRLYAFAHETYQEYFRAQVDDFSL